MVITYFHRSQVIKRKVYNLPRIQDILSRRTGYQYFTKIDISMLAPLTAQAGKKKSIEWTPECQKAFDEMKAIMAKVAFLRYPDHNKPFDIYADASDTQLGAAIFQDGAPVAFFSRKLNSAQRNYTTGEKEILSVVETLKEFHTLLYGCQTINVHTDHKNNIFTKQSNQRVLRWRLFLEDYGINLQYIKGCHNHLADALSRLPFNERQNSTAIRQLDTPHAQYLEPLDGPPTTFESFFSMAIDDDNLLDCFVNLPSSEGLPFVLDYATIADAQTRDALLQQKAQTHPQQAPNTTVTCFIPEPNAPWKIDLPAELNTDATHWYHLALGHIGFFNAICEQMHHTVGNTLRTLATLNPPNGADTANRLVDTALANCMFAIRATVHGSLQTTPGGIAFQRDMILNLPLIADFQLLKERRQHLIDDRLIRANRSRFSHDYHVGEQVLKLVYKPDKLQPRAEGPFPVHQVHTNGTVTIQKNPHTIEPFPYDVLNHTVNEKEV